MKQVEVRPWSSKVCVSFITSTAFVAASAASPWATARPAPTSECATTIFTVTTATPTMTVTRLSIRLVSSAIVLLISKITRLCWPQVSSSAKCEQRRPYFKKTAKTSLLPLPFFLYSLKGHSHVHSKGKQKRPNINSGHFFLNPPNALLEPFPLLVSIAIIQFKPFQLTPRPFLLRPVIFFLIGSLISSSDSFQS